MVAYELKLTETAAEQQRQQEIPKPCTLDPTP